MLIYRHRAFLIRPLHFIVPCCEGLRGTEGVLGVLFLCLNTVTVKVPSVDTQVRGLRLDGWLSGAKAAGVF